MIKIAALNGTTPIGWYELTPERRQALANGRRILEIPRKYRAQALSLTSAKFEADLASKRLDRAKAKMVPYEGKARALDRALSEEDSDLIGAPDRTAVAESVGLSDEDINEIESRRQAIRDASDAAHDAENRLNEVRGLHNHEHFSPKGEDWILLKLESYVGVSFPEEGEGYLTPDGSLFETANEAEKWLKRDERHARSGWLRQKRAHYAERNRQAGIADANGYPKVGLICDLPKVGSVRIVGGGLNGHIKVRYVNYPDRKPVFIGIPWFEQEGVVIRED